MIRYLISKMAGTGVSSKVLVFNFHNILAEDSPSYAVGATISQFKSQVDWLSSHFDLQPLESAVASCRAGVLLRPTACITFDDGYKTQFSVAATYLKEQGIPATFFVTSGHFDDALLWNDLLRIFFDIATHDQWLELHRIMESVAESTSDINRVPDPSTLESRFKYMKLQSRSPLLEYIRSVVPAKYEKNLMMSPDDVRQLHEFGFEVGAHSLSHPILLQEELDIASEQITRDIDNLSEILGGRIQSFAFPNGKPGIDFDESHILVLARKRIQRGLTSAQGYYSAGQDPLQISRVCLRGSSEVGFLRSVRQAYFSPSQMLNSRGYEEAH